MCGGGLRHLRLGETTVPIFVPTPCIEGLRAVASALSRTSWKSLKTSNFAQRLTTVGNGRKLLIIQRPLATNQKVGCSSHPGRTTQP